MKHPHAELMALYAQDAMTTDKPWELWECKSPRLGSSRWTGFVFHPSWDACCEYRRKPVESDLEKYGVKTGDVWLLVEGGEAFLFLVTQQSPRKGCYVQGLAIGEGGKGKVLFEKFECALYFRVGEVYKL